MMEEQYFYSPSRNGFYFLSLKPDYENSEKGWPEDAVAISERWYQYLISGSSARIVVANEYGQPVLADPPQATEEELIAQAENQKAALMLSANNAIAPLQDAVDLGEATEDEQKRLLSWKKYRVLLSRIKPEDAPEIEWPEVAEDVA